MTTNTFFFYKGYLLGKRVRQRIKSVECTSFWARLASLGHSGLNSDHLMVSKFNNGFHDPKGQVNKIYTIVKGPEMFYHRHTVPITSALK